MSPLRNTLGCQSLELRVFEATYFVTVITFGQKFECVGPVRFPCGEGLAAQQQIHRLGQPLLHHGPRNLVRIREKPPAILKPVAVRFLVLYTPSIVMNSAAI